MPNANYIAGRKFEYDRMKYYKEVMKNDVIRASGSHGAFDLVVVDSSRGIVTLIQCKLTKDASTAARLLQKFRESPPLIPMKSIHQTMEVKVKGSNEVHSVTV